MQANNEKVYNDPLNILKFQKYINSLSPDAVL